MKKGALVAIGLVVVLGAVFGIYQYRLNAAAAKWSGPMKEIVEEEITHDNAVTRSRFVSIIDAPVDKVQQAVWQVEDFPKFVPNFKFAKLLDSSANKKRVEVGIQALTLPLLSYEMEFTNLPAERKMTFKTLKSQAQDIEGVYVLEPSPDGAKTRITYTTVATDKVAVPFPQSVLDSAGRETFVNTIRGVQKALKAS